MGTGSNRHVVGLDAVISLFSSSRPIVVKHCSSLSVGHYELCRDDLGDLLGSPNLL